MQKRWQDSQKLGHGRPLSIRVGSGLTPMCACQLGSSGLLLSLLHSADNGGTGQGYRRVEPAARKLGIHGELVNPAHFPQMGYHLVGDRNRQCAGLYVRNENFLRLGNLVTLIESCSRLARY